MITCDLCNGVLVIEAGGKFAKCSECGMLYSIERVKEKMNEGKNVILNVDKNMDVNNKQHSDTHFVDDEKANFIISEENEQYKEEGVIIKVEGKASHIVIPDGYSWFGEYQDGIRVFEHPECVKSVRISETLNVLGNYAFSGCENLEEIYIPSNIKYIGYSLENELGTSHIFEGCKNLKVVAFDQDALCSDDICYGMFKDCKNLVEVVLPNTLDFIAPHTFENCENLESIIIPDQVAMIGQHAFKNCKKLKNVVLPNHDIAIHPTAFEGTLYQAPSKYTNYTELNKCPVCHKKVGFFGVCKSCKRTIRFKKSSKPWCL